MKQNKLTSKIILPDFCLVLLMGGAGSGKSTFAQRFFSETEIISSDHCRALVCDDAQDQSVSGDAFALLYHMAELRLKNRRLTVIDATNLSEKARQPLRLLAKKHNAFPIIIVINPGLEICQLQNRGRLRIVPDEIVVGHQEELKKSLNHLEKEAFYKIFVLNSADEIKNIKIEREALRVDQRVITGKFDIIGDIHGCFDEAVLLLEKLGYQCLETDNSIGLQDHKSYHIVPPSGRRIIFLGDLVDRGPKTPEVLTLVKSMVENDTAFCVQGNHEVKLIRWFNGKKVNPKYGLAESVAQIEGYSPNFQTEMNEFIQGLPSHIWLDGGKLLVAHAGLKAEMHGRMSGKEKSFCLYGDTTGEKDEFGWPVRLNWGADYDGAAMVVYGHTPVQTPEWQNNSLCIDTGCVFGGELTALRYPEKELVSVKALKEHTKPKKPLGSIMDEGQ